MQIINPFSDFGKIVTGNRFIGRKKEIKSIQDRLLGINFGNVAIIGLPRIGKSSLAWNAIYSQKENLLKNKTIVIRINSGEFNNSLEYFKNLILKLWEVFSENSELITLDKIEPCKELLFSKNTIDIEFISSIQKLFRILRRNSLKVIYILDEFDNVKNFFSIPEFQLLRDLSTNPETQIALLTVSRKTLTEIEPENGVLSNFYQIFYDIHLGLFNNEDFNLYWNFARNQNIDIKQATIEKIRSLCSKHPFLLDLINNELFNHLKNTDIDFDLLFDNTIELLRLKILNEYRSIVKLMTEEKLASPAIQLIVGPTYNVDQIQIETLLKYQLIKIVDGKYVGFCNYFNDYIMLIQKEIDVWPLWSETETELRSLIKIHLNEKYGEDWLEDFKKANPKKEKSIASLESTMKKNKSVFGDLASCDLIDYTYPSDMIDCFIHSDWKWFSKIFNKQFNDWKPIFDHLAKIRNPLAHNNIKFISEADKNRAIGYCQEIIRLIQEWKIK